MKTLLFRLIVSLVTVAGFCSCHTTIRRDGSKTTSVSPVIERVLIGALAGAVGNVHAPPCRPNTGRPQGGRPRMMAPQRNNYRQYQAPNPRMKRPTYGRPNYGSYQPKPRPTYRPPNTGNGGDPYYNNYRRGHGGPIQGPGTNSDGSKRYPYPYYPYPRRTP